MAEWYYARNNQRLGPVSMEQMKQLAASGQLSPNDLVWKDGMANWAAAGTIQDLFAAAAPAAPVAPIPVQAAARPAAALAPEPGVSPDEVVPLAMGGDGSGFMDTALLIATRSIAVDLDSLKVSDPEKTELAKAGITGETAQRYLVWRRSMLWVALVPLAFSGLSLIIESALHNFKALNGFGILLEVLRILTLLALPGAAAMAALMWNKPQLATRLTTLGFLVCFGFPIVFLLLPAGWYTEGLTLAVSLRLALLMTLLSIPAALVRGALRIRSLLPESSVSGLLVVMLSLMSALYFFGFFFGGFAISPGGLSILGVLTGVLIVGAPLCYVIAAKSFLKPIVSAADRGKIALWQWIYFGLCGGAALALIVDLLVSEIPLGALGVWVGFILFLDFLGRSLFASVVATQFLLPLIRSVAVSQEQLAKTDQGPAFDRRLSELEPIIGKM